MEKYQAGGRFGCGVHEYGVVGGGFPVVFLEADSRKGVDNANVANWYYEGQRFPLWQLVWPAENGCFPWEPDYPIDMKAWQPDLTPASNWGGLGA